MKILILGNGGREHALAWKLSLDSNVEVVKVFPEMPAINYLEDQKNGKIKNILSVQNWMDAILSDTFDLVIAGQEKYIYQGVKNFCLEEKINCLAPTIESSELERSKLFSKKIMFDANIPTANYIEIRDINDLVEINNKLNNFKRPVIKLSGPAQGKGVFVTQNKNEAVDIFKQLAKNNINTEEGIFIEEALCGVEMSCFYLCNGAKYHLLASAQDYKRLLNDDKGPNTGGMGAISPSPLFNIDLQENIESTIVTPLLQKMEEINQPFTGVLFLGLMVENNQASVIEYNVRFGDPETQAIMPLLADNFATNLYNFLEDRDFIFSKKDSVSCVHVVKASQGYPGIFGEKIEINQRISTEFFSNQENTKIFFAGANIQDGYIYTNGGRVFGASAWSENFQIARQEAYRKVGQLNFNGQQFRTDIGAQLE